MNTTLPQDSAVALSLQYLRALETRLQVEWAGAKPICVPGRIREEDFSGLESDLNEILTGSGVDRALDATRDFGEDYVQTVGFGFADNFDQFVKLGFIYGDRLVLWDVISSRILSDKDRRDPMVVASAACNILALKAAVSRGAVVVLPHPLTWCDLAERISEDMRYEGVLSPAAYALST